MKNIYQKIQFRINEYSHALKYKGIELGLLKGNPSSRKFVIICNIRTGSTMLTSFLENHKNVLCFFELFHRNQSSIPFGTKGYFFRGRDRKIIEQRNSTPTTFLKNTVYSKKPQYIEAVGFKLLYSQARNARMWWDDIEHWWGNGREPLWCEDKSVPSVWDYLKNEKVHVIHLTRKNQLESAVSAALAHKTGNWGIGATGGISKEPQNHKVYLDPEKLAIDFAANQRMIDETNEWFKDNPLLQITYEDLINRQQETLYKVQKFLGLSKVVSLQSKTKKQNKKPLTKVIENYYELKAYFLNTPYSSMFN